MPQPGHPPEQVSFPQMEELRQRIGQCAPACSALASLPAPRRHPFGALGGSLFDSRQGHRLPESRPPPHNGAHGAVGERRREKLDDRAMGLARRGATP